MARQPAGGSPRKLVMRRGQPAEHRLTERFELGPLEERRGFCQGYEGAARIHQRADEETALVRERLHQQRGVAALACQALHLAILHVGVLRSFREMEDPGLIGDTGQLALHSPIVWPSKSASIPS